MANEKPRKSIFIGNCNENIDANWRRGENLPEKNYTKL